MYFYPKQVLTIEQQFKKYEDSGMIITSREDVIQALKSIGYYRLRGYSYQLYDNKQKKYKPNTSFDRIIQLYNFDQELSNLIFSMLSKIEVALRVKLVEALLIHNDALILLDSSVFVDKEKYWRNMSSIASEIARSNDVFIKHNFSNHDGEIPVWAAVEVMSFGSLSKVIKNLTPNNGGSFSVLATNYKYKSPKGNIVTPSKKTLSSWIQAVSILRNMCAHNSRIYNWTINTAPVIIDIDKMTTTPTHNGLYQILLAMKYLRPSNNEWLVFISKLEYLIEKNIKVINLNAINFPQDWKMHLTSI